uniref:EIPR1-like beta-propeller domain-containing protein n=1 Tax=Aplanochytrium stocchinoi TaxID=215587 RepID=A0A7S3LLR3_9STRA|eukprot:CAMPEP_0204826402 /NCGR_PEP_ID=MMETSP1346-20131115/4094_1 /ASSEMBLY_ACC=CAM_ASM_000771 /TAXON_ID=215587 /ORGANISM="Aplanochytrium stocchinoi, Strain GSBS06" /LENGTH=458 /DNA_ID=CAMNT_0051954405 /DNA_START=65 /DNA_END=1441 /DNA_ORIENTATION=-
MFSTTGAVHDLKCPCRCIESIKIPAKYRDNNKHWFLVGTQQVLTENQKQNNHEAKSGFELLEYSEDSNAIIQIPVTSNDDSGTPDTRAEIWSMSAHPANPNLVFVICSYPLGESGAKRYAKLCRFKFTNPNQINEDQVDVDEASSDTDQSWACSVEVVKTLNIDESIHSGVKEVIWCPIEEDNSTYTYDNPADALEDTDDVDIDGKAFDFDTGSTDSFRGSSSVVTIHDKAILRWDLEKDDYNGSCSFVANKLSNTVHCSFMGASWDPHRISEIAVGYGQAVEVYDIQGTSGVPIRSIPFADRVRVRQVDHNPNKPFYVATAGDDRTVKFWDIRHNESPVKILSGHSHWVDQVKYNKSHDQLVISAGTDTLVSLWRVSSISSAPLLDFLAEDDGTNQVVPSKESDNNDALIKSTDDHFDSVYSIVWSCNDAWIYASVSYDGRVCVNHVPSAEKYKILL